MAKEYSPFTPGIPVPLEFFVGRTKEIQQIVSSTQKSIDLKTIERIFVMGERGIGKSSICKYAQTVAEVKLGVLGLHVYLGGVNTLEEMAKRIFERLLQDSIDKPWYEKTKEFLGKHVKQVDIFGVTLEFSATQQELSEMVSHFPLALKNLLTKVAPDKKGILLILDDINGLASSERFANWFKSFVDEMATARNPVPITILLVGLPERRSQLIKTQPSLDRVFDLVNINRFSEAETREFYQKTFSRVNVAVEENALESLCKYSGGFPVFMHELGDIVYKADSDNHIDNIDVTWGIWEGIHIIGSKYIEPRILEAIKSKKYQHMLGKIAFNDQSHRGFTRKDLLTILTGEETKVLDNFLRRMKDLGVVCENKAHDPTNYEFTSELYRFFFYIQELNEHWKKAKPKKGPYDELDGQ